jgi:hypothetical protein
LLACGRWFSPGTPASSTTKTGRHDIAEILLKVALNNKNQIHQIKSSILAIPYWRHHKLYLYIMYKRILRYNYRNNWEGRRVWVGIQLIVDVKSNALHNWCGNQAVYLKVCKRDLRIRDLCDTIIYILQYDMQEAFNFIALL